MSGVRAVVPWVGAVGFLLAALMWLGQDRRLETKVFDAGSVFNTSAEGLSLAHRYLREDRSGVRVLTYPLSRVRAPADAVVFRVRPTSLPFRPSRPDISDTDEKPRKKDASVLSPLLTQPEEEWVRSGGRLVLALERDYGRIAVNVGARSRPAVKVFPLWPGVRQLLAEADRVLVDEGFPEAHALFVRGERPAMSRAVLGRGEVIVLACPEVLDNGHLGQGDHLALLHALAGKGRPVQFDEYVHGLRAETGLLDLLTAWGLGPLLASLALLSALAFWRARTRLGPPEEAYADTRSDAVDLLDSLAQLYERTLRREEAVRLYYESLRRTTSLRTGLRGPALERRLKELMGARGVPRPSGRGDLTPAVFDQAVRSINDGFRRLAGEPDSPRRSGGGGGAAPPRARRLEEHAHPR